MLGLLLSEKQCLVQNARGFLTKLWNTAGDLKFKRIIRMYFGDKSMLEPSEVKSAHCGTIEHGLNPKHGGIAGICTCLRAV